MSKKFKYIIGITMIICVIIISVLIVNFFEIKDNDAVKGSLVIWTKSDTYEYMKKSAEDFMELNGKADIKVIQAGENEVYSSVAQNNMPDIAELSSSEVRSMAEEFNNISFLINDDIISSFYKNYTKTRINEVTREGSLFGVPISSRPLVLYIREDMLQSYGYTYSQINTWDDLIGIGKDIKEKSGGLISILNAVDQDYYDLISLLIMQGIEEKENEEDIKKYVDSSIAELSESGILNTKKNGQFLARISSNNGMRELSKLEDKCAWTACNVPSKYNGSNKFYVSEGENLVVLKNYDKNNKLIKKFMDYIANNNNIKETYILNGDFFTSFLSSYNRKAIEGNINNFIGISPVVVMNNISEKAPTLSDYDLYIKIKKQYE